MLSLSTQLDREWQPEVTEPNHRRSCLLRADLLGELLFIKRGFGRVKEGFDEIIPQRCVLNVTRNRAGGAGPQRS